MTRLWDKAEVFDPRTPGFAAGRTLLALAQLAIVLTAPARLIYVGQPQQPWNGVCTGTGAVSLWCVAPHGTSAVCAGSVICAAVLAVVAAGWRPRWFAGPHWYISFSMLVDFPFVNGGEGMAVITAGLLALICLSDRRRWHWTRPDQALTPARSGVALAASTILRLQLAIVYASAAISKLHDPGWRAGTALFAISADPENGPAAAIRPAVQRFLAHPDLSAPLTWGVMAAETAMAVCVLLGPRARRTACVLGICMHGAIILFMGLFSFALIMIASLLLAAVDGTPAARTPASGSADAPAPDASAGDVPAPPHHLIGTSYEPA